MNSDSLSDDFIHIADTRVVRLFLNFVQRETELVTDVETQISKQDREKDTEKVFHLFSSNLNQGSGERDCFTGFLPWSSNQVVTSYLVELWDLIERIWRQKRHQGELAFR